MSTVITLGPVGFKPTGAYDNTREYKKLDVVIYQGSCYIAKSDSIGQLPTNTTYWELLVQKGDTGNGITSIAKTGTSGLVDTYTITYTDETTSTFTVTNGEKGDPGEVTQAQLDETNNQVAKTNMVYNALPKVSDEGDNLTLDGTANCPMKMELKGNTEQNGTPTPDSPIDVRVVMGNNSVKVIGKNLFDTTITKTAGDGRIGDTTLETGKKLTWNGASATTGYMWLGYVIKDITNYVGKIVRFKTNFSTSASNTPQYAIGICDSDGDNRTSKASSSTSGNTISFTIPSLSGTQTYLYVLLYVNSGGTLNPNDYVDFTNMILTIDNEDMTYIPYQSQTYPINLGTIELCKIGTYQDYIYKDSGKWYKHSEIGKVVLDGSEENLSYNSTANRLQMPFNLQTQDWGVLALTLCDHFTMGDTEIVDGSFNITRTILFFKNNNLTSLNDWKTWLGTHNTTLYYVLETPTNTEITDTTLISQLNAIENAVSYDTQTNIVQENYSEPFIINAECVRSLKDIFELIQ